MEDSALDIEMISPTGSYLDEEAFASMESLPMEELEDEDEDEDLYYIPERRPSLDLGQSPGETGVLVHVEQPKSPVVSYSSMSSEGISSSTNLSEDDRSHTTVHLQRTGSFSSCYSVDSDDCEIRTLKVKQRDGADDDKDENSISTFSKNTNEISHSSLTIPFVFKAICKVLQKLKPPGFDAFRKSLWQHYPQSFNTAPQTMDIVDVVDRLLECYGLQSLQITKTRLRDLELRRLVDFLDDLELQNEVQYELRQRLKMMYGAVECPQGDEKPLDEVFIDLHIKSVHDNGPNIEHEVMLIQKPETTEGKDLCIEDIFSSKFMETRNEQLILLHGAAGSGKSMVIRKLIHNWSNQKAHDHFTLMFPLPLKALKQQFGDSDVSFLQILHSLYPETKRLKIDNYSNKECKIMYIFEGLEDISEDINFEKAMLVFDIQEPAKLNVLIANILREQLLKYGYCLFTTRPLVDYCIPWDTHHCAYEVLGFKEEEREKYFKMRFKDQSQAGKVIAHVKSSKTLHIMCYLPLFCSLLSDLCQTIFNKEGSQAKLPKGITYWYTRLLLAFLNDYYKGQKVTIDKMEEFIMTLGRRAFNMLEKGEYFLSINYQDDDGVDAVEAVTQSGLSTLFYTKPLLFVEERIFGFLHPTIQEYLSALYAFLSFVNKDTNVFEPEKGRMTMTFSKNKKRSCTRDLNKYALERSLSCEDGKLDIFMRFLFGMSNPKNAELIQTTFNLDVKWKSFAREAENLLMKMIEKQHSGRVKNLEICLEELLQ